MKIYSVNKNTRKRNQWIQTLYSTKRQFYTTAVLKNLWNSSIFFRESGISNGFYTNLCVTRYCFFSYKWQGIIHLKKQAYRDGNKIENGQLLIRINDDTASLRDGLKSWQIVNCQHCPFLNAALHLQMKKILRKKGTD